MRFIHSKAAKTAVRFLFRDDRGQVMPVMALMMISLLGIAGFAVDGGHAFLIYRKLQASTDAAALAGAAVFPSTAGVATATTYSGVALGKNPVTSLGTVSMVSGYPKVLCLTSLKAQGMACTAPANGNAMAVKQQVVIPVYFLRVLGKQTLTLTASATAAIRGSTPTPYNVAVVLDQTLSMNQYDADCGATQGSCALQGLRVLLQALSPCPTNSATCTINAGKSLNPVDTVAVFTYPAITASTASIDANCTTPIPSINQTGYYTDATIGTYTMPPATVWNGVPTATYYSFPATTDTTYTPSGSGTYQLTDFLSDYKVSDTATSLNPLSTLVRAAGGAANCGGMLPPNYAGVYGTYYASSLYAATAALTAQKASHPGSQNVIILLSDGDANSPASNGSYPVLPGANNSGFYPSYVGNCGQAIVAAQNAAAKGIRVYSVAYGTPQTGCSTDINAGQYPNTTPCLTMAAIASAPQYFFSDYKQTNSNSNCYSSAQQVTSLAEIFKQIASDLTVGRLIPDNTP